ncbi:MAG: DUF4167 domain-containing protein [Paracoccus sp. (in: a-proteobacteria)]|uniref:DUF4167 domain-containing protein n=1 Tax=Paracoccus sp. TaxID=267 RepID=UPI0026DF14CA|nr:DUF4167 domain-containing protein [Paracoccus sp. (in: a-proteobacteria)]MDO5613915.1 DUF4167 domain-containing protein [Paracoccus sp. (in: a-proteobacteria)]
MRSSKSRSRNKSNRQRSLGNIVNRVFDSSGPEGKVRGTPQQIIDKYLALARDAQLSNDRVAEQSFLQHAEHYTRMLGEAQREMAERQQHNQPQGREDDREGASNGNGQQQGHQGQQQGRDQRDDRRDDRRDDQAEAQPAPQQPAPQQQPRSQTAGLPDAVDAGEVSEAGPVATPETTPDPVAEAPVQQERPRRPRAPRSATPRPRRRRDDAGEGTADNNPTPAEGGEPA